MNMDQLQTGNSDQSVPVKSQLDQEALFKQQLHQRLLEVIDLTLINTMGEDAAREQVHLLCQQLIEESTLPMNMLARKRVVKQIEDEVLGLGPLEPLLATRWFPDLSTTQVLLWVAGASSIGLILPNIILDRQEQKRVRALRNGFPDALDLFVVCVEAGLGLDATILIEHDWLSLYAERTT